MQHRRMPLQHNGFVLLPVYVQNLFLLRYARERLVDNLQTFQRRCCGMKLTDPSVNHNQARQRFPFFLHPAVSPGNRLPHAGKIIVLFRCASVSLCAADDELPIVRFLHPALFPHDHGRDRVRSLDVRDVETLNPLRLLRHHPGLPFSALS